MAEEYLQMTADKFIFRVKKGLLYSSDDVWVDAAGAKAKIGVTDFFQRRGGDIIFLEPPEAGRQPDPGLEVRKLRDDKGGLRRHLASQRSCHRGER
jgi:hypothetical protein